MHRFEIIEHALHERNKAYSMAMAKSTFETTEGRLFRYIKKGRKLFKLKPIRKWKKKIKKKIRKLIKAIHKSMNPDTSSLAV